MGSNSQPPELSEEQARITVDSKGHILSFDALAISIFGYSNDQFLEKSITDLTPNRFKDDVYDLISSNSSRNNLSKHVAFCGLNNSGLEFNTEVIIKKYFIDDKPTFYLSIKNPDNNSQIRKINDPEIKYQSFFDSSTEIIFSVDKNGAITFANNVFSNVLGYNKRDLIGIYVDQLILKSEQKWYISMFHEITNGTTTENTEITFITKKGNNVLLEGKFTPKFSRKKIVGYHAFFRDITKIREVRERLQKRIYDINNEIKRRADALDAAIDGISIFDENGLCTYSNNAFKKIMGYSPKTITRNKSWKLFYPESSVTLLTDNIFPVVNKKGHWSGEITSIKRTGVLFNQELSIVKAKDLGIIFSCKDITERKKNEAEILSNRDKITALNERQRYASRFKSSMKEIAGKTGKELFPALIRSLCTETEASSSFISIYKPLNKSQLQIISFYSKSENPLSEYKISGTPCETVLKSNEFESLRITKNAKNNMQYLMASDGSYYLGMPIRDANGKPTGVISITSLKPIKDLPFAKDLLHIFSKRVSSELLALKREELLRQNQKMEALGKMASGMAHDFNNLLTIIQGNLSLAKSIVQSDPNLAIDMLKDADNAASQGKSLTGRLLELSKRKDLQLELLPLISTLNEFNVMAQRLVSESQKIHSTVSHTPGLSECKDYFIYSDKALLHSVLLNIVKNSSDAQPQGGIIRFQTIVDEEIAIIQISDEGTGITDENLKRIFEPFFTTKSADKGTGLGLALAEDFINHCGGKICVQSQIGCGTTFTITLPVITNLNDKNIKNNYF